MTTTASAETTTQATVSENGIAAESEATNVEQTRATIEGTAGESTSQSENAETQAAADAADEADPVRQAIAAAIEEARQSMQEQWRTEFETQFRGEEVEQAYRQARDKFPTVMRETAAALKQFKVTDPFGQARPVTDGEIEPVLQKFSAYQREIVDLARAEAQGTLQDEIYAVVPRDQQAEYTKAVNDKPLVDHLRTYVEMTALNTKAVKGLTLERAMELSPKLKSEVAAREAVAFTNGRKKGQGDPSGEPKGTNNGTAVARGYTTKQEARALHARGELSNAEMREINRSALPEGYS